MLAIAPRLPRTNREVQYFSSYENDTVIEFDYPKSESPIGTITGVKEAWGECTNGARTFWVVASGSDQVLQFKAGGTKPIATLSTASTGVPSNCAIDPITGNLAVAINSVGGYVVIFKPGSTYGTVLNAGLLEDFSDGYDANGDLFVDGYSNSSSHPFQLVELPKGSNTFEIIVTSNTVSFPGTVQWDGTYLTIGDPGSSDSHIYRYHVIGTKATLKGTVSLAYSGVCNQTWIARPYVYCPSAVNNVGQVYKYPAGGSPVADLVGSFNVPAGVVSLRVR
jgi:hypothetical protein